MRTLHTRARVFDIKHTVESAQPLTFFGDIKSDGFGVTYACQESLVEVEQKKEIVHYSSHGPMAGAALKKEISTRFRLKDEMEEIYDTINTDKFISEAIKNHRGMRVTKNEPWETTLCFLISQFNNLKRIRGIVKRLMETYGEEQKYTVGNVELTFNSFPSAEIIAKQSVKDLMKHGAGFRAKYIKSVAQQCSESFDLDSLYKKSYYDAKQELIQLPGIGDKVADCILLFGYGKLQAFPIDTWIKRIVETVYFGGKRKSVNEIHMFADEKWGAYAGYAQQYLFWAGRKLKVGSRNRKRR